MSVNTWSLKQRIKELTNENNELRRKRAELEEKVALKTRQEEEILASRPRPSQSNGSEIIFQHQSSDGYEEFESQPHSGLLKCIALEKLATADLIFTNEHREVLGDWEKYQADVSAGSIHFHAKFTWNELLLKANGIEITFRNTFHKQELGTWLGNCIRKNNLQRAFQSIVEYATLSKEREKILTKLNGMYKANIRSDKSQAKRCYVMEIVGGDFKYMDALWAIKWDNSLGVMCHSFTFEVVKTPEAKALSTEQKHILKELLVMDRSLERISMGLEQLVEGAIKRQRCATSCEST